MPIFASERLYARTFMPQQDAPEAFLLYGNEEIMRFLGTNQKNRTSIVDQNLAATEARLARYAACEDGHGIMALIRKTDDQLVGTILLKHLPDAAGRPTADWEVGWHLLKTAWGHGYASEAGAAAINFGRQNLNLDQIYAVVDPENLASRKVVTRLGMKYLGLTDRYYGENLELFGSDLNNCHETFHADRISLIKSSAIVRWLTDTVGLSPHNRISLGL